MSSIGPWLASSMLNIHLEQMKREARSHGLPSGARLERPGWLSERVRWLSGRLGELLVAFGRRLQRPHLPQALSLERESISLKNR
jgi:hypothetical protein